jgi:PAS domain S-box-containing protein
MESRIDSLEWSKTSIGPRENWSQALRTTVRILLANRFPMLLWWGPDYISLYNDAYIPILGQKHPWGLGKPVSECWAEIWDILKPLIDTPFYGGPATWSDDIELHINRSGFMEETHFTVAYSPVPDETATRSIGGVLATVHEITAEVVGQRRGIVLRELASAVEAKTAKEACVNAAATLAPHGKDIPFAVIYLAGEDGIATLAAASGIEGAERIAPATIRIDDSSGFWPLHEAQLTGRMQLVNLSSKSTPISPWPDPPNRAAVLPIRSHLAHGISGFLIAGLSSRLKLDDSYTDFLNLVTSQIATAISTAAAYEEERKRAEALAEIDRAKTAFFSNVSHEFRTPLTLMLGPLEEMLKADQLAPRIRESAELAHRNSLRLLKLVNSLLDFARIEADRIHASYMPVDLAAITRDLTSNFRSAAEAGGLELAVKCGPLREPVYADVEMWEKIVLNLLSNAFKFTLHGTITVTLAEVGERVILSVADTGIGIPDAELPHIFERFHRVDGAKGRSYEGTGIGLALVQELVRIHGGKITVKSEAGIGTTFYVEIPRGQEHLPEDRVKTAAVDIPSSSRTQAYVDEALRWLPGSDEFSSPKQAGIASNKAHTPRVLLADDNADMRDYVARLLGERMQVTAVNNGKEALVSALKEPPDLILSDIMMPVLDGFGLLREVRGNPNLSHIPVILLSARAGEESRVDGVSAGADDYLVKPFSAAELLARVTTHLKLAGQRQETVAMLRRLQEVSTRLISESDLTTLLGEFLDAAIEITHADMGNVQLLDAATGQLRIAAHRGFDGPFLDFFNAVHSGIAACGSAMQARHRTVIEDVASSAAFDSASREPMLQAGARAIQSTPLVTRSGKLVGVLSTHYHAPTCPAERELQMVDVLARQTADLIEGFLNTEILRAGEERLTLAIEAAGMGTWDVDLHTGTARWSRRQFEILGYKADPDRRASLEMWRSLLHPEDREKVDQALQRSRMTGERYVSEHRILRANTGEVRWLAEFGRYVSNPYKESQRFIGISFDITDRIEAVRTSLLLSAIVDSSDDAIISKRLDGVITSWNKSAERLFGYTAEEAIGKTVAELLIPEDRQDEEPDILARLARGERVDHFETVRRRKDGTLLDISLTISPVKDDRGLIIGASKIARDITGRKQADAQLRESEERFRALVTASSDAVYQMSGDWTEMRHLVGRDFIADTLEPSRAWMGKYIHPDDQPRLTRTIQEAIHNKSVFALEHRVIRADGTLGWTYSRAVPILNDAGEIIEWFGAASDITNLTIAEEALRQSEERFRQLAEVGPQMVWLSGPQGELEFVNRRWVEYSGLEFQDMRDPDRVKSRLHPQDDLLGHWQKSVDSGTPFELEARLRSKSGEFRWFMMRSIPVRDEQGRIQRWFGTSTDIHESKLLQLELQRANQDLEQFAYSASHDLQEPLRSVRIFSELLFERSHEKFVGQELEFLHNVRDGAGRMEMLVRDLLAYTRATKAEKPLEAVDSNAAFQAALGNLAGAIAETGATVNCEGLPLVPVHATQLQQLFQNLIGNALKYHRPGVPPIVHATARRENGTWIFSVADNGIGIEPEFRERIFGLFKRLHTGDEYSGTGIGLAICQRIVERNNGRIWVESEPGKGSTFNFTLPV